MGQNRSSAVMQQRSEPHHSLDDFPTPPWATRALCEFLSQEMMMRGGFLTMTCREPAANRGHMARPLSKYFGDVLASDVHDYGVGMEVRDYLFGPDADWPEVDWTITNPPFRLAEQFIARARRTSRWGVAVLVRTAFLESVGRYRDLFRTDPPTHILQFSERVVIHKGQLSEKGSTATAYCWLIWDARRIAKTRKNERSTQFHWVPPCRAALERKGDYA